MQHSRLLSILLRLQAQGRVSAPELARAFEVSVRTIYRDIDALSAAGVPVYAESGRRGGFQLVDGYRTNLTGLDRAEADSLFLAGVPVAAGELGVGADAERARLKLLAALPEPARAGALRVAERFHFDPVPWFQSAESNDVLPRLATAVWEGRWIRMRYASWKAEVDRRVAPLGLVQKSGTWYLVGAVDDAPRTYRVASIRELSVEDTLAPARAGFDLRAHWDAFTRDYEARMASGRAVVRASERGLVEMARTSAALSRAVDAAGPPDSDGRHPVEIPIESVERAVLDLLRWWPDVVVLAPAGLAASFRARVEALHAGLAGIPAVPPDP